MDTTKPAVLKLKPDEIEFLLLQTGIESVDDLKKHIWDIHSDALKIKPYICIYYFDFIRFKMSNLPWYNQVLQSMKIDEKAILLDLACCLGTDVRKAIIDGCPAERIIASDIYQEFWNLGHKFFKTNPEETFPKFFCGDVLDSSFIPDTKISPNVPSQPQQDNMASYVGQIRFIHVSNLFHLFNEADQNRLAERLAGLLSRSPGSMIFGTQTGRHEKGYRTEALSPPASHGGYLGNNTFCHSVASWTEMWLGVFPAGTIRVEADLIERSKEFLVGLEPDVRLYQIEWCITVL
ncbi:hypothetical protein K435DRAFT_831630 [Dendrothele bispora CBS 962.96]|uniref:Methyltransferase domain-containing protein n=1 Tax=Dendrothele bispora (strain CBS 962.96) TaxID=1314807 RepID=A0A4S8L2J4_DENBC|nr:hypothetical protein K435DRAFT_831630 [Dendrothele bispora CBS 962.96]